MRSKFETIAAVLASGIFLGVALSTFKHVAIGEGGDKPRLKVRPSPVMALSDPGTGGAVVTIYARIEGEITEEWYCPEATFLWPDDTKAVRESDCPPWEAGEEGPTSWNMARRFPPGEWGVVVELRKAGRVVAREVATVRVAG